MSSENRRKGPESLSRQVTIRNVPGGGPITNWEELRNQFARHLFNTQLRDRHDASVNDLYNSLALVIRDQLATHWIRTQRKQREKHPRMVYYLSLEFYLGRMLKNAIANLRIEGLVKETCEKLGIDLKSLYPAEKDAGLGNGGLGRLAACFLDSMATLNIPCVGYGLRYEYGIFEQIINEHGEQVELADNWLEFGYAWEVQRIEDKVEVMLYGHMEHGKWVNQQKLWAIPHDIAIPGYDNGVVGTLRLWRAKAASDLAFQKFNEGEYVKAVEDKNKNENITRVLYPNDSTEIGKELRLKQEYFLVAATIKDIIRRFFTHLHASESRKGNQKEPATQQDASIKRSNTEVENDWLAERLLQDLPSKVAIQLNDTHPSLAIPELLRVLVDDYGIPYEKAWSQVKACFFYTNHTVLPEALEKWPVPMLQRLLPRHLELIYQINSHHLAEVRLKMSNTAHGIYDDQKVRDMSLIEEHGSKSVRMALLSIAGSSRVNGVARVHSELIRKTLFANFVSFYTDPQHFTNVTNGVTPRRWLLECNEELSTLITDRIGTGWICHLPKLQALAPLKTDANFLAKLQAVKRTKKEQLQAFIKTQHNIDMNPDWLLSVQVKRIHEYKRQLMNVLHVVILFLRAQDGDILHPRTYVIGGKAAPGYLRAKKIIKLISMVSRAIDRHAEASKYLKLIMLPNYGVSTAEILIPAADLSEQISLAGMEASGTGNMKFMMNGALTIGTLDGANMEIYESVDRGSMFEFGMRIEEVPVARETYQEDRPRILVDHDEIRRALDTIANGYFFPEDPHYFRDLVDDLRHNDYYMLLRDLPAYMTAQQRAAELYYNSGGDQRTAWCAASLDNIRASGRFSSDETIKRYADNIWQVKYDDRSGENVDA